LWAGFLIALPAAAFCAESFPSVLEYLGTRATRLAAQLPAAPDTLDNWNEQQDRILDVLPKLLALPDREPMKAAVIDRKQQEDLVIEEVAYLWAERAYVSANVIRSAEADGRRPALVVPPGWLGHYTWPCYKNFVFHMARLGYVVLFIDDPHIGKRQAPYAGLYAVSSAAGTPVMGIQVFDTLRGLDYLVTRPDVDPGRIGVVGLCQGAEQAWLAGALESRFPFVVPVCGTTTYEAWARMPTEDGIALSDPSPYVAGILSVTDWDRINACIAPRPVLVASNSGDNWWPVAGYDQVIETMTKVYKLHDASGQFVHLRDLRSHDMTPFIPEIAPWIEDQASSLNPSNTPPHTCGKPEDPDFKMLRYFQRRIAAEATSWPTEFASLNEWQNYRDETVGWLREACNLEGMRPTEDQVIEVSDRDGLVVEQLHLSLDGDFGCPALLLHAPSTGQEKQPALILSHAGRQCMNSPKMAQATNQLAQAGYWVLVPEHASLNPETAQSVDSRGLVSFYGVGDTVNLPPLALRAADNLAAFRYLASRAEIDPERIAVAGLGIGSIDACLAACLESRIAGAACVDVTTFRDWAEKTAPEQLNFTQVMPYLPSMLTVTDLDYCFAALAPRPLVVARLIDGWPESGFEQVRAIASHVYALDESEDSLIVLGPRGISKEQEDIMPDGLKKQLVTAARALMPTPPTPGVVGTKERLRSRKVVDSAGGIVWVASQIDGYDQQFVDGGYRLDTWSFFNDNGTAQAGRVITPLIFRKEGDRYVLTGIGRTQTNSGTGLQSFPFEPVEGTSEVGAGYYFGWHTGDLDGNQNAGVAEFEDNRRDRMTILTLDGGLSNQKIAVDNTYRVQSEFARAYSIHAVSKRE
jgi:dienelactone hydrolase